MIAKRSLTLSLSLLSKYFAIHEDGLNDSYYLAPIFVYSLIYIRKKKQFTFFKSKKLSPTSNSLPAMTALLAYSEWITCSISSTICLGVK